MATAVLRSSFSPLETCTSQLFALGRVAHSLIREKDEFEPVTVIRPSSTQYFSVKDYLADRKKNDVYWAEEKEVVQAKCALLFFVTPLFAAAKMIYAVINTVVQIAKNIFLSLHLLSQGDFSKSFEKLTECSKIGGKGLWEIVKAPLFCISYQSVALYGLYNPFRARKYIAQIEQIWNYNIPFLPGIKECKKIDKKWAETLDRHSCFSTTQAISSLIAQKAPVYIAPCLQPRGSLKKEMTEIRSPFLISCLSYFFHSES